MLHIGKIATCSGVCIPVTVHNSPQGKPESVSWLVHSNRPTARFQLFVPCSHITNAVPRIHHKYHAQNANSAPACFISHIDTLLLCTPAAAASAPAGSTKQAIPSYKPSIPISALRVAKMTKPRLLVIGAGFAGATLAAAAQAFADVTLVDK